MRWRSLALGLVCVASPASAQLVEYYHTDVVGNVRAVTDEKGNILERHDYLPFGEECVTGPCASNPGVGAGQPRKFTGKERDSETALDYFGARYYGSKIGRFTTTDPFLDQQAALVDPQRWCRYTYGRNNPLRYVDPDGRDAIEKAQGAYNAFVSDYFLLPFVRGDSGSSDFRAGQAFGDRLAMVVGAAQTAAALAGEAGGAGISFTGVGAAIGVPAVAASAGVAAHGATVTAVAGAYLSKNAADPGSIYLVPGSATSSGKPYVGRHNKPNPAKTRRSKDGRDRTKAEVVDTYDAGDTQAGRVKEQEHIDERGLENLDNKRNEIRKQ